MPDVDPGTSLFCLATNADATELVLCLSPGAGAHSSLLTEIIKTVNDMAISAKLDKDAVKDACRKATGKSEVRVVIAKGKPRVNGRDAKLIWSKKIAAPREKGGRLSHYLGRIHKRIVHKDDPVAKIIPETEGEEGCDVYGNVLKPDKGKPLKLRPGQGVRESDNILYAEKDGMLRIENDSIKLDEVFVVEGDLDFEIGNLDFPGSVIIAGGVLDLFEVTAGGSIQIKGLVEGANLTAKGDIEIGGGIEGKTKGRIVTQGSLTAKFLVNAYVYAEGDVTVEGEIVTSKVAALGALHGPECAIAGGQVEALGGIDAQTIGSEIGARTVVAAGAGTTLAHLIQINAAQIDNAKQALLALKHALAGIELSPDKVRMARAEIQSIQHNLKAALIQRKKLALAYQAAKPVVLVRRVIYPGVSVRVGRYHMAVNEEIIGPLKLVPDDKTRTVRILSA